ncbi:uncharacterized protein METZ01_LOCUS3330, partial [marine metagenome]
VPGIVALELKQDNYASSVQLNKM